MKAHKFNPYLQMHYDTKHDELIMSPKTFKMWMETFKQCSNEQNANFYEVLDYFTRKENSMVKYFFNGKVQICKNKRVEFWFACRLREYHGESEIFDNGMSIGLYTIFWG